MIDLVQSIAMLLTAIALLAHVTLVHRRRP